MQRRRFLIGAGLIFCGLGLLVSGAATDSMDAIAFVRLQLERLFGEFILDSEQEYRLLGDFVAHYGEKKLLLLMCLYQLSDNLAVTPHYAVEKIASFERKLVTHFLTGTDYIRQRRQSPIPAISYWGRGVPCTNPFAKFTA